MSGHDPTKMDFTECNVSSLKHSFTGFTSSVQTEQAFRVTIEMMESLKAMGFSFAIDDFGTGYSSLAYLKKMPVDVIKIDKSFVFGMLENHSDFQIITSTIAMVKNLGLLVVAEGVETQAQLRSLIENDCDIIQGYYYSKSIPEHELFDMLDTQTSFGYWKVAKKATDMGEEDQSA